MQGLVNLIHIQAKAQGLLWFAKAAQQIIITPTGQYRIGDMANVPAEHHTVIIVQIVDQGHIHLHMPFHIQAGQNRGQLFQLVHGGAHDVVLANGMQAGKHRSNIAR